MKSTEDLIKELSQSHAPVSRDLSPAIRTALTVYGLSALISFILYLVNPFTFMVQNKMHGLELISLFLFLNAVIYFGFKSFVPGEKKDKAFHFVVGASILLILSLIPRVFIDQSFNLSRANCEIEAMAVSMITTFIGHLILRKTEYGKSLLVTRTIFLSLPLMAVFFLHGVCSLQLGHVISCHVFASLIIPVLYLIITNCKKVSN